MKSRTDWIRLRAIRDRDIDFSDLSPVERKLFKTLVIRMPQPKRLVSLRLDPDVLTWFKKQGKGYQTRINAVLRSYVETRAR